MTTGGKKDRVFFRANSRYRRILEEISAGDKLIGFLCSATSTRLAYQIARKRASERYRNKRTIEDLERKGYVRRVFKDGNVNFFITKEGKHCLHNAYKETDSKLNHNEHWDREWRILIYDFPEQERSRRNSLRYILTKSKFLKIQKSVWIFPHDAPLLSSLLAKDSVIHACTIYIKAQSVSSEDKYKKHFGLK